MRSRRWPIAATRSSSELQPRRRAGRPLRRRVRRHARRGRRAGTRQPHRLSRRRAAAGRAHLSRGDGDAGLRGRRVRRRRRRDVGLLEVRRRRRDVVRRLRRRVEVLLPRLRRGDRPLGVRPARPGTVRRHHGHTGVGARLLGGRPPPQLHPLPAGSVDAALAGRHGHPPARRRAVDHRHVALAVPEPPARTGRAYWCTPRPPSRPARWSPTNPASAARTPRQPEFATSRCSRRKSEPDR